MSKKHFEAIAAAIHQRLIWTEEDKRLIGPRSSWLNENDAVLTEQLACVCARVNEITDMARDLAKTFGQFNHNFDEQRFLLACGIE